MAGEDKEKKAMATYYAAKVLEDMGFLAKVGHERAEIQARNYDQAADKAIRALRLQKGEEFALYREGKRGIESRLYKA